MLVTFSMSSRQRELSVNEMCEYLIPSSLYCGSGEEKEEEGEKEGIGEGGRGEKEGVGEGGRGEKEEGGRRKKRGRRKKGGVGRRGE